MPRTFIVSHAERGLQTRNFTCDRCRQRWPERDLREQDGLRVCVWNCYEQGGGEIDRQVERARASELGAVLNAKEMRPPIYPGSIDSATALSFITDFSIRPLVVTAGGATGALTLSGGFQSTDTVTYDDANLTNTVATVAATSIALTVQAGASARKGAHVLLLNGERYLGCIDVR